MRIDQDEGIEVSPLSPILPCSLLSLFSLSASPARSSAASPPKPANRPKSSAPLTKRVRHLRRWPKQGITCYRLYEQDIPEVPLVVDRYEDCLHIAEFSRPTEHTPAEHADWLDLMLRTAAEVTEVPVNNVFLKRRERQRGAAKYERLEAEQRTINAHEGGLLFEVNLSNYLDTGLFLDHRITRGMVHEAAAGKRFLNLFAYTGSFSVYAAAGGAAETVTVDLSNTYLDWARRNMALNGFTGPNHEFVRDDTLHFLKAAAAATCLIWPSSMLRPFPTARPWKTIGTSNRTTSRCSIG